MVKLYNLKNGARVSHQRAWRIKKENKVIKVSEIKDDFGVKTIHIFYSYKNEVFLEVHYTPAEPPENINCRCVVPGVKVIMPDGMMQSI